MAELWATPPRRRRRWPKILAVLAGGFLLLLVVVYFVGTSSAFFKGVILPRVSKSLNAEVTVSDASISPFKQVILKNLKVQTTGTEPLLTASEVRARYSLFDIIGGNIHVEEAAVVSPKIVIVQNADGTSNLDPITKGQKTAEKPSTSKPGKTAKPPQIDIKKVALTDATIVQIMNHPGGKRDVAEVSHVNLTLEDLKNGTTGKSTMTADVKADRNPPEGQPGSLQARINANFTFALSPDLKPGAIKGTARMEVTQATGSLAELASLTQDLNCEISPTEIKEVALHFQRNNTRLGEVRIAGPFSVEKMEGRLQIQVSAIDRQVLNLAGAASGIDFGSTTVNSTNDIQLTKAGSAVTAAGRLSLNQFQVIHDKQASPPLDLRADYDVTIDRAANSASLRALSLAGVQKGRQVISANLTSPMTLNLGPLATNAIGDSALNFNLTGLDLADWKAFVGDVAPVGTVNLNAKLLSQQGGKAATFDLDSKIENLTAGSGSNQITQATVTLQVHGQSPDLKQFKLADYKFQLARQDQSLLAVSGSGTFDQPTGAADVQFTLQTVLPRLLAVLPRSDIALSSGTVDLKGRVVQTQDTQKRASQTLTGNLALTGLTGKVGNNEFHDFGAAMDLDVLATPEKAQIRKATGKVTEGSNAGGSFDVSGAYDLKTHAAQLAAKLVDFNQYGLRTFLEPMLADKKLASISLNATATTQYQPGGDASVKASLQVTNLVVTDPQSRVPSTPLEAKVQIDTSVVKQVAEIRQMGLTLTPTAKAKNELTLQGRVDMTDTNAFQGNLQVAADSLDVTRYYDLFANEKKSEPAPAAKAPARGGARAETSAPGSSQEKEPDPVKLPFRKFTAGVNIGRFYLREVEITNLQTTVLLDGSHVLLDPFKLALNGAPATAKADLDLGTPGYIYDVALDMKAIPLAPLVNSFQPERKGKVGGTITALANLKGKGTTGASLQKNLTGQFDVGTTNLNLAVENIENKLLRAIVEVVSSVPDLVKNPLSVGTKLVVGATGLTGGMSEELKRSPVDVILVRGTAGSGRVDLQQSAIQSPTFRAEAVGTITLAPVLTNSALNLPISILLERSVAEKFKLAAGNPDAKYAKLPDFLTIKGTIGDPKKEYNKAVLTGMAAKGISAIPGVGGQAGGIISGVGNLLTGQPPTTNAAPGSTTNPPPAKAPVNDLLNQFLKPRKK